MSLGKFGTPPVYGDLTKPKQILWGFLHAKNQNSLAYNFPTGINRTVRIGNFCGKCVTENI